jgi:hypothetical protein
MGDFMFLTRTFRPSIGLVLLGTAAVAAPGDGVIANMSKAEWKIRLAPATPQTAALAQKYPYLTLVVQTINPPRRRAELTLDSPPFSLQPGDAATIFYKDKPAEHQSIPWDLQVVDRMNNVTTLGYTVWEEGGNRKSNLRFDNGDHRAVICLYDNSAAFIVADQGAAGAAGGAAAPADGEHKGQ